MWLLTIIQMTNYLINKHNLSWYLLWFYLYSNIHVHKTIHRLFKWISMCVIWVTIGHWLMQWPIVNGKPTLSWVVFRDPKCWLGGLVVECLFKVLGSSLGQRRTYWQTVMLLGWYILKIGFTYVSESVVGKWKVAHTRWGKFLTWCGLLRLCSFVNQPFLAARNS